MMRGLGVVVVGGVSGLASVWCGVVVVRGVVLWRCGGEVR